MLGKTTENQTQDAKGKAKSTLESTDTDHRTHRERSLSPIKPIRRFATPQQVEGWSSNNYGSASRWSEEYVSRSENHTYGSSNYYALERERASAQRERELEEEKERNERKMKMERDLERDRKKKEEDHQRRQWGMVGFYALSAGSPEVDRRWASKLDVPPDGKNGRIVSLTDSLTMYRTGIRTQQ